MYIKNIWSLPQAFLEASLLAEEESNKDLRLVATVRPTAETQCCDLYALSWSLLSCKASSLGGR